MEEVETKMEFSGVFAMTDCCLGPFGLALCIVLGRELLSWCSATTLLTVSDLALGSGGGNGETLMLDIEAEWA